MPWRCTEQIFMPASLCCLFQMCFAGTAFDGILLAAESRDRLALSPLLGITCLRRGVSEAPVALLRLTSRDGMVRCGTRSAKDCACSSRHVSTAIQTIQAHTAM